MSGCGCEDLTECDSDEYETTEPTSDRECTELTVCTDSQFQSEASTSTDDGECSALTICTDDEYQSTAPTDTSDRQCSTLTDCAPGEYVSVSPAATQDRECRPCATGTDNRYSNHESCYGISVGETHSCYLDTDANPRVNCWGNSADGRLNAPDLNFVSIDSGDGYTCGLLDTPNVAAFSKVSAGLRAACGVLKSSGDITCWGSGLAGLTNPGAAVVGELLLDYSMSPFAAFGTALTVADPSTIEMWGLSGLYRTQNHTFKTISAGGYLICGILSNNKAWCYSDDDSESRLFHAVSKLTRHLLPSKQKAQPP